MSGVEWIPSSLWGSEHLWKKWGDWKTTAVFICNPSLPYYDAHIGGKEKRTAPVSVPPSSLFPGWLEFTQVEAFVVSWKMVNSAPLYLQRESQLHHTFHPVTPWLIKICVAKVAPLKISFIMKSAGYRQIEDRLIREKILLVKCAVAHSGIWLAANWLGNVLGQNPWNSQASYGSTF